MFNTIKWMALVLKSFIDIKQDFLSTVNGGIGIKNNEKVTIPVFDISDDAIQEDGEDTVFVEPDKSFVEIETKREIKLGISSTRKDLLSTDADLMAVSAKEMGNLLRRKLSYRVREDIFRGPQTANKITFDVADGGTGVTTITHNMFLKASEMFSESEIPEQQRFVLVPPSLRAQIVNLKDSAGDRLFIPVSKTGESVLFNGHIGSVDGWKIAIAKVPMLSAAGGVVASPTKKAIAFYHKSALAWGSEKKIFVDKQFNNIKAREELFNQIFYGAKVVHGDRVITVRENS